MDPALTAQLTALGAVIIGALGTRVTLLVERIKRDLAANTQISTQARDAANGRLKAVLDQLAAGKVRFAGLDVFVGEPAPRAELLNHPKISTTPHIGASTEEAQERIGLELANRIIDAFGKA
jgi:lactate dehydrogenase-like 2-hydroxyacid dehydrogenase